MAKLNEDIIVIKASELLKDNDDAPIIFDAEMISQLEIIIQELVGEKRLVEINK
jgi:hypothetical protein